ncbi:hypothetical protein QL285_023190 [Trifolium repens]|nr:hypothetical protein QL285_023190 [Trifolium repens]
MHECTYITYDDSTNNHLTKYSTTQPIFTSIRLILSSLWTYIQAHIIHQPLSHCNSLSSSTHQHIIITNHYHKASS